MENQIIDNQIFEKKGSIPSDKILLDGKEVSFQELAEARKNLTKKKKIVEIGPGVFKTLTRFLEVG